MCSVGWCDDSDLYMCGVSCVHVYRKVCLYVCSHVYTKGCVHVCRWEGC